MSHTETLAIVTSYAAMRRRESRRHAITPLRQFRLATLPPDTGRFSS